MDGQDIALSRGQTMRGNSECAVSGHSLTCECSLLDTGEYCSSEAGPQCALLLTGLIRWRPPKGCLEDTLIYVDVLFYL